MDDADLMGCGNAECKFAGNRGSETGGKASFPAREQLGECPTRDEPHDQVGEIGVDTDIVDGADVRVVDIRRSVCFTQEPLACLGR